MSKLSIKYLEADAITPYINNTRTHSEAQLEKIKSSINEFGMCTPIGIHNGTIIYGHARFTALKALGHTEFPTVDLSHLSEAQKKAYIIADNRLALDAGWDEEMLKLELESLQEMDFDLDLVGFGDEELELMLNADANETDNSPAKEENYSAVFNIIVECSDEQEQESVYDKLTKDGYLCQVQSL